MASDRSDCHCTGSIMGVALGWEHHVSDPLWFLYDFRTFFYSILFYPVIEEMSFRGVIQGVLRHGTVWRHGWRGITWANLLTSSLFAAVHTIYYSPSWAILIFFPSLVFGYFRDRTGSVGVSIFLHMFYNFCFLSIAGG